MGITCRKTATFLSLVFYLISLSLVICSLFTDNWVVSVVANINGAIMEKSRVNSGLLSGMRVVDWGFGARFMPFSVLVEIQEGTSFYYRILWIFILFFISVGILWICVGVITSLLSSFIHHEDSIIGPIGTYLWSLLALLSLTASCTIFYIQFHSTMQKNLLTSELIDAGYSSSGLAKLGSSFYIMVGALAALYFPPLFVFISTERTKSDKFQAATINDPTALLY